MLAEEDDGSRMVAFKQLQTNERLLEARRVIVDVEHNDADGRVRSVDVRSGRMRGGCRHEQRVLGLEFAVQRHAIK